MDISLRSLAESAGRFVVTSSWREITQTQIDLFAQATDDDQWIHTDPARARSTPQGVTIAHGYLTLSLLSAFRTEAVRVADALKSVNYGLNRVRFIQPVPVGSRLRGVFSLVEAEFQQAHRAWMFTWDCTVEIESRERPACVAQALSLYYLSDVDS